MDFRGFSPDAGFGLAGTSGRTGEGLRQYCRGRSCGDRGRRWRNLLADTIRIEKIREEEAHEGIRVLLEARLANARIPL